MYILNVYLKNNSIALHNISKLLGIGNHIAKLIFNDLNISFNTRVNCLTHNVLVNIVRWIDQNRILVENSLRHRSLKKISNSRFVKIYRNFSKVSCNNISKKRK